MKKLIVLLAFFIVVFMALPASGESTGGYFKSRASKTLTMNLNALMIMELRNGEVVFFFGGKIDNKAIVSIKRHLGKGVYQFVDSYIPPDEPIYINSKHSSNRSSLSVESIIVDTVSDDLLRFKNEAFSTESSPKEVNKIKLPPSSVFEESDDFLEPCFVGYHDKGSLKTTKCEETVDLYLNGLARIDMGSGVMTIVYAGELYDKAVIAIKNNISGVYQFVSIHVPKGGLVYNHSKPIPKKDFIETWSLSVKGFDDNELKLEYVYQIEAK